LRERGDVKEVRWAQPRQLYEKFLPVAQALVVTDPDVPASVNVATMLATPEDIRRSAAGIARQIRQFTPARRPAFLHVSLTHWFVDMRVLVEVEKALGPDYAAVRADHLAALYREAKKRR